MSHRNEIRRRKSSRSQLARGRAFVEQLLDGADDQRVRLALHGLRRRGVDQLRDAVLDLPVAGTSPPFGNGDVSAPMWRLLRLNDRRVVAAGPAG
jgi:hypothetical protein